MDFSDICKGLAHLCYATAVLAITAAFIRRYLWKRED